jgi:hypothetical protein
MRTREEFISIPPEPHGTRLIGGSRFSAALLIAGATLSTACSAIGGDATAGNGLPIPQASPRLSPQGNPPPLTTLPILQNPAAGTDGIVDQPTFINIYWDTSAAQWNTDVGSQVPGTIDQIDAFVGAVVYSDYLTGTLQYGVTKWGMGPSIVLGDVCPASLASPPSDTSVGHNAVTNGIPSCLQTALNAGGYDTGEIVLNYIYPPKVAGGSDLTAVGPGTTAYHDHSGGIASVFVPISQNKGGYNFTEAITHEMVEAVTDCEPHNGTEGWKAVEANPPFAAAEAADLCEGQSSSNPLGLTPSRVTAPFFAPLFNGSPLGPNGSGSVVSSYYSNADRTCISGFGNDSTPTMQATAIGRGKNMRFILNVQSPNDDMTPPVVAGANGVAITTELNAVLNSAMHGTTNIGRFILGDTVFFSDIEYQNSFPTDCVGHARNGGNCNAQITVTGLSEDLPMSSGDTFTFNVYDPINGLVVRANALVPAVGSANFAVFPGVGWTVFGDDSTVAGYVSATCQPNATTPPSDAVEGELVEVFTAAGTSTTLSPTTSDATGFFSVPLAPLTAGHVTVELEKPTWPIAACGGSLTSPVKTEVDVHPVLTGFGRPGTPNAAGSPTLTLVGAGYTPMQPSRTTVTVAGVQASASGLTISGDGTNITFTSPFSEPGHTVQIIAYVDGVPSEPLSYTFAEPPPPPECNGVRHPTTSCAAPNAWLCCSSWVCARACLVRPIVP